MHYTTGHLADEADSREQPFVFEGKVQGVAADDGGYDDLREKGQNEGQSHTGLHHHKPTWKLKKNTNRVKQTLRLKSC